MVDAAAQARRAKLIADLGRVADGDQAALRCIYDATAAKLFGVCLRISGNREAAEDILQQVYIKVWDRAGRFDAERASPITWLCAIARNTAIDWRRANGADAFLPESAAAAIADDSPLAPDVIDAEAQRVRIFDCLDALEDRPRRAIRSAFFDGLTYSQLAEAMAVPLGTLKSWVRRGLIQLRGAWAMADPMIPEERDVLAAELALGLLEGKDRAQAMRLALSDPEFAAAVEAWSRRFEPLYERFEAQPSPALWPAIQRRLGNVGGDRVRRALVRWRIGALASSALAASLALVLFLRPAPAPVEIVRAPERTAVAQLGSGDAPALLAASYDPAGGVLRIRAVRLPGSNLAPELWVIPADGVPRSLGLVASDGVSRVDVSAPIRALLTDGATLAITLEPRDGAPHKAPSSAPIAAGKISTI